MELTRNQAKFVFSDANMVVFQSGMSGGKTTAGVLRIKRLIVSGKVKSFVIILQDRHKIDYIDELIQRELKGLNFKYWYIIIDDNPDLIWVDEIPCNNTQVTFTPTGNLSHVMNKTTDNIYLDKEYLRQIKKYYKGK